MKINKIKLREIEINGGKSYLDAMINEENSLVLEGCDTGEYVRQMKGDWDYEYWVTVKNDYKDTVLLHLIKDNFDSESAFMKWLEEREIEYDFNSYA
jgi:hypothetical protein